MHFGASHAEDDLTTSQLLSKKLNLMTENAYFAYFSTNRGILQPNELINEETYSR